MYSRTQGKCQQWLFVIQNCTFKSVHTNYDSVHVTMCQSDGCVTVLQKSSFPPANECNRGQHVISVFLYIYVWIWFQRFICQIVVSRLGKNSESVQLQDRHTLEDARIFPREVKNQRGWSEGEKISAKFSADSFFVSRCLGTVTGEGIKVTISSIPNKPGAHGHWPLLPEGRRSGA